MAKSCITVSFTYSLRMAIFLNTDISQGSVATRLGCGGVFIYHFVINFLLSPTVKEFWKSVNIWWSYGQELGVLFFLTHSVDWIGLCPIFGWSGWIMMYGTNCQFGCSLSTSIAARDFDNKFYRTSTAQLGLPATCFAAVSHFWQSVTYQLCLE